MEDLNRKIWILQCLLLAVACSVSGLRTADDARVQRRLAALNKRTKGGCSCLCLMLSVIGIVALIVVIYILIKYGLGMINCFE